jgi:enamine deaminase RidA (YjgF/YER057c/UK114 family)|tara:strand:- start:780 stop:1238 length:459 start_codon:yes stop_codon:yes gene_type:complete
MIKKRLKDLGISIPNAPKPAGSYVPVVLTGKLAFVSGQIPIKDGQVVYQGKVGDTQSIDDAQEAAKLCVINGLAQIEAYCGTLDNLEKIIKISGFVNSTKDFTEHPKVINAASDLLMKIFDEKGRHSRIAIGVSSLPLNATVEIDMVVEIAN